MAGLKAAASPEVRLLYRAAGLQALAVARRRSGPERAGIERLLREKLN
jgi:hypothetical protein